MTKHIEHLSVVVPLDSKTSLFDLKTWRTLLEKMLQEQIHCPACGGLQPELCFVMDGKEFNFVCYQIAEKAPDKPKKVLATTDYEKLYEYLRPK